MNVDDSECISLGVKVWANPKKLFPNQRAEFSQTQMVKVMDYNEWPRVLI